MMIKLLAVSLKGYYRYHFIRKLECNITITVEGQRYTRNCGVSNP